MKCEYIFQLPSNFKKEVK
ncbi:hypothetical protein OCT59_000264 [Rhizophagus irregularis]|nr:hypothetical protein OCT59_000264 [Rhizophagus irregularis]